jgi:tryptophanyl-tRNA synthetase
MSKSLGNCIYLSETQEDVKKKVMAMYTDPNHMQVSDPGDTKNNPVFIYLSCFADDTHFAKYLPDYKNLDEMKAHYERGGLGDVKCKRFLINVLEEILAPIREKRAYYEAHLDEVYAILKQGTDAANAQANATLAKVRAAMKINYFEDSSFLSEAKAHFENK